MRPAQPFAVHVHAKVDNHAKRQPGVQPRGAPLVAQREERVGHDQQRLDRGDVAAVQRAAQQLAHALPVLPPRGAHVGGIPADLEPRRELGGAKVQRVEQQLGEVRPAARHVPHKRRPVRHVERVVLPVPVQVQQVHAQIRVHAVKVKPPRVQVQLLQLPLPRGFSNKTLADPVVGDLGPSCSLATTTTATAAALLLVQRASVPVIARCAVGRDYDARAGGLVGLAAMIMVLVSG